MQYNIADEDNMQNKKCQDSKLIKDNIRFDKFLKKTNILISDIDNLKFDLPENNEQIRIITQQRFNAFALFKWLYSNVRDVTEIILTSYRIDKMSVIGIEQILKNPDIKSIIIVLSAFFTSVKKKEPFAEMLINLSEKDKRIHLIFCHNHTKIIGVKNNIKSYIIEGSGNLTGNARIEQYMIEENKEIFEFHKTWITELSESTSRIKIFNKWVEQENQIK